MVAENALFDVNYLCRPVATPIAQPSDHRGSRGSGFFARVVDIGEDIDFILVTEDVGIIGAAMDSAPFASVSGQPPPESHPLTRRLFERTTSGPRIHPEGSKSILQVLQ